MSIVENNSKNNNSKGFNGFNPEHFKIRNIPTEMLDKPIALNKIVHKIDKGNNNSSLYTNMKLYNAIDIDFNDYEILAFSDIHADYNRFIEFLEAIEMIKVENNEFKWNPLAQKKVIVICGDLIDGNRPIHTDPPIVLKNDPLTENNELYLHILIYNLRLDALKHDSYIFCTMGNHDFYAFHSGPAPYIYHQYIDEYSAISFIRIYFDTLDEYIEKKIIGIHKEDLKKKINEIMNSMDFDELVYFARNFVLSRFYCIGYPFFLKINHTLFAHAGFYKEKNIFTLFENKGANEDNIVSPQLIHRKILEKISDIENHITFFIVNDKRTYYNLYALMKEQVIKSLKNNYREDKVKMILPLFNNTNETSLVRRFFETREFQKNCTLVDQVLKEYRCNLLVVGHCPTCIKSNFKPENVIDIDDGNCDNAHIVLTCDSTLASVDIAFSSAFSPQKKFYEYLMINENEYGKTIQVKRMDRTTNKYIPGKYPSKMYDTDLEKWV